MKKIASLVFVSALLFTNVVYADAPVALAADTVVKGKTATEMAGTISGLKLTAASTAFYATVAGALTLVVTAVANDNGTTTTHMSAVHH